MVDQVSATNGDRVLAANGIEDRGGGWYGLPTGQKVRGRDRALRAVNGRARLARNASEKLLRDRFAQLAGLQYGRDRDIYEVAGYPQNYDFAGGWDRYRRQDIARRIVDLPVQKTWRHPPQIMEGEKDDTEFTKAWTGLWERLGLQAAFERADRMSSIGEYSVAFIGFAGAATDVQLREPVAELTRPEDVLYVRPYKQNNVTIEKWVKEPGDERFGKPELYRVDLSAGDSNFGKKSLPVHWSRILHIVEDPLDSDVYGLPRLERVLNRLMDLEKVCAATGEAFWQLAVKILQVSIDPKASLTTDEWDDLDEELEEMVHDLRRHFMGKGIDMEYLGGDTPDPKGPADLFMMLISAACGIPKRVLFGTETGERASEQDERAFLGMVAERQEQFAEPTIVRPFTDRLIQLGALPEPKEPYSIVWPDLFEMTTEQKAEIDERRSNTAKNLTPIGGDPRSMVEIDEEGRVRLRPDGKEAA